MRSESTKAFGQPRLTKLTRGTDMFFLFFLRWRPPSPHYSSLRALGRAMGSFVRPYSIFGASQRRLVVAGGKPAFAGGEVAGLMGRGSMLGRHAPSVR